ncbi:MAG: hypothetical protein IJU12_00370 [Clostridia bacterium]|nr:hypothetical protein [Clostridia bacterium]
MSGAEIAHYLKNIGHGNEWGGVLTTYRNGFLVGVGSTLIIIGAGVGVYKLAKWGYGKSKAYLAETSPITVAGEVQ